MTDTDALASPDGLELEPAASLRGPLTLEARAISKQYRLSGGPRGARVQAVREVSFGLYRGAIVALVGESGSGKSTVAKLLAGQERCTSGAILLDGREIDPAARRTFRAYKGAVQMVFQDPFASLSPVHTVRYHLQRPLQIHRHATSRADLAQQTQRLLEQVRLTPPEQFLAKFPHELSGGQRQRVAISRALAVAPRVLLADEPVSMLDVSIRLGVLDLIDDLRTRLQLAVLYITHDIASARYFADETLVMYAGELIERGPSEELTQRPAHPYTQLLVSSAPDPDRLGKQLREAQPAATQAAGTSATAGCPFSPRCQLADERCRAQAPSLQAISRRRAVACWRVDVAAPGLLGAAAPEREEATAS